MQINLINIIKYMYINYEFIEIRNQSNFKQVKKVTFLKYIMCLCLLHFIIVFVSDSQGYLWQQLHQQFQPISYIYH